MDTLEVCPSCGEFASLDDTFGWCESCVVIFTTPDSKECIQCKLTKPVTDFRFVKGKYLQARCRSCESDNRSEARKRLEADPEYREFERRRNRNYRRKQRGIPESEWAKLDARIKTD